MQASIETYLLPSGNGRTAGWTPSREAPSPWSRPRWCPPRRCAARAGVRRTARRPRGDAADRRDNVLPTDDAAPYAEQTLQPRTGDQTSLTSCPTPRRRGSTCCRSRPSAPNELRCEPSARTRVASRRSAGPRQEAVARHHEPVPTALVDLVEQWTTRTAPAAERPLVTPSTHCTRSTHAPREPELGRRDSRRAHLVRLPRRASTSPPDPSGDGYPPTRATDTSWRPGSGGGNPRPCGRGICQQSTARHPSRGSTSLLRGGPRPLCPHPRSEQRSDRPRPSAGGRRADGLRDRAATVRFLVRDERRPL